MRASFWTKPLLIVFVVFHGLVKAHQQRNEKLGLGFVSALTAIGSDASFVRGDDFLGMRLPDVGENTNTLGARIDTKPLTVVAFFESWCVPCRDELIELQALHQRYAGQGLNAIGVYSESTEEAVQGETESLGLKFTVVRDAARIAAQAGLDVVPSTIVFGRDHSVLRSARGPNKELSAFVEKHLSAAGVRTHE